MSGSSFVASLRWFGNSTRPSIPLLTPWLASHNRCSPIATSGTARTVLAPVVANGTTFRGKRTEMCGPRMFWSARTRERSNTENVACIVTHRLSKNAQGLQVALMELLALSLLSFLPVLGRASCDSIVSLCNNQGGKVTCVIEGSIINTGGGAANCPEDTRATSCDSIVSLCNSDPAGELVIDSGSTVSCSVGGSIINTACCANCADGDDGDHGEGNDEEGVDGEEDDEEEDDDSSKKVEAAVVVAYTLVGCIIILLIFASYLWAIKPQRAVVPKSAIVFFVIGILDFASKPMSTADMSESSTLQTIAAFLISLFLCFRIAASYFAYDKFVRCSVDKAVSLCPTISTLRSPQSLVLCRFADSNISTFDTSKTI